MNINLFLVIPIIILSGVLTYFNSKYNYINLYNIYNIINFFYLYIFITFFDYNSNYTILLKI